MRNGEEAEKSRLCCMKKFKLVSLIGITSIALAHAGWAAGHNGGGGGFGGGGFSGGHPAGVGGGGPRMGGFGGGGGFGGPRFSGGMGRSFGGRSAMGMRPSYRHPINSGQAFHPQAARFRSANGRAAQISRSSIARSNQRNLSASHHVFARHSGNWHRDWDRHHAHFSNGHWWCFNGGAWIGFDAGFYPWDYYYADGYYDPYDYYAAYDEEVNPEDYSDSVSPYRNQYVDTNLTTVQSRLARLGYYRGAIDGVFGPGTRAALTRYQIDRHLRVTGSLTTDTLQSLGI
jgi:hypothetical protein